MGCCASKPGAGDAQSNPMSEPASPLSDRLRSRSFAILLEAVKEIVEKAYIRSAGYKAFIALIIGDGTLLEVVKTLVGAQDDRLRKQCCYALFCIANYGSDVGGQAACVAAGAPAAIVSALHATEDGSDYGVMKEGSYALWNIAANKGQS